jgi:cation:H+ antiporter
MPTVEHLSAPWLGAIFLAAAVATWVAGVQLSNMTDVLSERWRLGQALGGVILLAISTNLPEIAITASAAVQGELGLAVGNILGGIAIQTVVLVILDAFGARDGPPLTFRSVSLLLVLEAALVNAVLIVAIMATQLPADLMIARLTPGAAGITVLWLLGVWLLARAAKGLPWTAPEDDTPAEHRQSKPKGHSRAAREAGEVGRRVSTTLAVAIFTVAAAVTLVAGVLLEQSGAGLADHIGMSGVVFGGTVLAAATALPEVSTGLASMKLKDYQLAVSDIFGGNAFLPVLFLLASLLSGQSVLPAAEKSDIYLAGLGVLLTTVYATGLIFRPRRKVLGMGIDSLVVLVLYIVGVAGLVAIARGR